MTTEQSFSEILDVDEARLERSRIRALFNVSRPSYPAKLIAAGVLLAALWGPFTWQVLLAWFAAATVVTIARVVLYRRYQRAPEALAPLAWESRYAIGTFATGAVWAFAAAVFFAHVDPPRQMIVLFLVGGTMISAAGLYAPSTRAFVGFGVLPLAAMTVQLAVQPEFVYRLLAFVLPLFAILLYRVFHDLNRGLIDALRTRQENEVLAERLAYSGAQLRDAIESFPDGLAIWDDQERLVVCNDAYARLFGGGRSAAELPGVGYAVIAANAFDVMQVPAAFEHRREEWIEQRIQYHKQAPGVPQEYRTRDGRWKLGKTVRTRMGGAVGVVLDVTDLKRAQDAYLDVLAEKDLVLDTLPVGVAFVERGVIVRCNARLERMLGHGPGELSGRSARVLYTSDEAFAEASRANEQLGGGAIVEGDAVLARRDGAELWCRLQRRALNPHAPGDSVIVTFTDIGERRAAETALRTSEETYRNLVETSNDLIWSVDHERRWAYLNASAVRRIYGCEATLLLGKPVAECTAPDALERDAALFARVLGGDSVFNHETRHLRVDGRAVDLVVNAVPLRDARGAIIGATGTAHDITERKRAAAALLEGGERLRLAIDAASLYSWEWDVARDTLTWGVNPEPLVGPAPQGRGYGDFRDLVHPEDRERYLDTGRRALASGEPYACEFRIVRTDGQVRWVVARGKVVDAATRMIGVSQDVTERKRQEEEARFLAYHDTLTGLPNRRLLDDRLKQAVYLAQRRDAKVAAMLIDLDEFKQVNDTLGHRAGDAVLRETAQRLARCVRKSDTLARQGGDEFVVVLPDLKLEADSQVVAEKILRALEPEFLVDGRAFRISASIGVSVFPSDASDGDTMLRNADAAMYRAKQLGKNNYRFYGR